MMTPARVATFPQRPPTAVSPVEVTPAQRTRAWELAPVLRAIRAGEVWQEADGRSVETFAEYFGFADPIADVTEEVACAEATGLATTRPLSHGVGAAWELTPVGVKVLAGLDAKEK
jgi:hypothetical protein